MSWLRGEGVLFDAVGDAAILKRRRRSALVTIERHESPIRPGASEAPVKAAHLDEQAFDQTRLIEGGGSERLLPPAPLLVVAPGFTLQNTSIEVSQWLRTDAFLQFYDIYSKFLALLNKSRLQQSAILVNTTH